MFYIDSKTNEIVREWTNPLIGESVQVRHSHNDPENSRPSFPRGVDGQPARANLRRQGRYILSSPRD